MDQDYVCPLDSGVTGRDILRYLRLAAIDDRGGGPHDAAYERVHRHLVEARELDYDRRLVRLGALSPEDFAAAHGIPVPTGNTRCLHCARVARTYEREGAEPVSIDPSARGDRKADPDARDRRAHYLLLALRAHLRAQRPDCEGDDA